MIVIFWDSDFCDGQDRLPFSQKVAPRTGFVPVFTYEKLGDHSPGVAKICSPLNQNGAERELSHTPDTGQLEEVTDNKTAEQTVTEQEERRKSLQERLARDKQAADEKFKASKILVCKIESVYSNSPCHCLWLSLSSHFRSMQEKHECDLKSFVL